MKCSPQTQLVHLSFPGKPPYYTIIFIAIKNLTSQWGTWVLMKVGHSLTPRLWLYLHRCEQEQYNPVCHRFRSPTNYQITFTNEYQFLLRFLENNTRNKLSSKCHEFVIFFVCFLLFPSCERQNVSDPASGFQLTICEDKCASVDKLFQECINREDLRIAVGNSTNEVIHSLVSISANFTCSNPGTYIAHQVPVSRLCTDLHYIDHLLSTRDSEGIASLHIHSMCL